MLGKISSQLLGCSTHYASLVTGSSISEEIGSCVMSASSKALTPTPREGVQADSQSVAAGQTPSSLEEILPGSLEMNPGKIPLIIDTDANNELDDQHALAYAFFNSDVFNVLGVTVNDTPNGGGIQGQFDEAKRVMKLCLAYEGVPLLKGAEGSYASINSDIDNAEHDGHAAVDFIIETARTVRGQKLVLVAIGKLTNIALALLKAPEIIPMVRLVWLGSNYPEPGEYNLQADVSSVNPVIESGVEFEMATVRYLKPSGTAAVIATGKNIQERMPGQGPAISPSVEGRNGGTFSSFGNYSYHLFESLGFPDRSMYDMATLAIIKEPSWGELKRIPAPRLLADGWQDCPDNDATIGYWENFNTEAIVEDLFKSIENPALLQ